MRLDSGVELLYQSRKWKSDFAKSPNWSKLSVMSHPAEIARQKIMEALEAVQANASRNLDLDRLAQSLAKAQGKLFMAGKKDPSDRECADEVKKAMEFLAQALQQLQEVKDGGETVEVASKSIASAISTIFPIVNKAKETEKQAAKPAGLAAGTAAAPTDQDMQAKTIQMSLDEQLKVDGDSHFYCGFSENIDEGGIFVATFDIKKINSKILVTFTLPTGRTVTAKGLVRWVREYNPSTPEMAPGMGIRFIQLHPDDAKAITVYLKQRAPIFYDDTM